MAEDDLTHKLVDIIGINQRLRENIDAGAPTLIIEDLSELLQYHVTTYFNNEVSGIPPAGHRSGRTLKSLAQRLKGKEGRFRGNLSGKRVDYSARTVISGDPNIDINEVGVPVAIAVRLTVPDIVTVRNIEEMKRLVVNGPYKHPGTLYVIRPDQKRIRLEFVTERGGIADTLEPGFIVERHLKDGDIALFNRQPSLHRMSIMAMGWQAEGFDLAARFAEFAGRRLGIQVYTEPAFLCAGDDCPEPRSTLRDHA